MRTSILFFVGIIVSAGVAATPAVSEELIYSPWTKYCFSGMCLVGGGARTASDCLPRFGAVLIEKTAETKKTLRVTVPDSVNRASSVLVIIDQDQPIERRYGPCYTNLCSADIDGAAELVDRLKRGRKLILDAVGSNGPTHFELPLTAFSAAYDGPPQEPKVFEVQPGKLQDELQAQAQAERKIQCDAN
jgi:invasion protein IalB